MLRIVLISFAVLLTLPSVAWTDAITYRFTGEITRMFEAKFLGEDADPRWTNTDVEQSSFFAGTLFELGDEALGAFIYDPASELSAISDDGYQGVYLNGSLSTAINVPSSGFRMPDTDFFSNADPLSIIDGRNGWDGFAVSQFFSNDDWFVAIRLNLWDTTGTLYDGFTIPDRLDLDDFDLAGFRIAILDQATRDQLQISGNVSSLRRIPVPEPATIFLLGGGLIGIAAMRRCGQRAD